MPKKTRKQKLLADHRRLSIASIISSPQTEVSAKSEASSLFQFQVHTPKLTVQAQQDDTLELITIERDITKTALLAAIAISIELTIFWLLHSK